MSYKRVTTISGAEITDELIADLNDNWKEYGACQINVWSEGDVTDNQISGTRVADVYVPEMSVPDRDVPKFMYRVRDDNFR